MGYIKIRKKIVKVEITWKSLTSQVNFGLNVGLIKLVTCNQHLESFSSENAIFQIGATFRLSKRLEIFVTLNELWIAFDGESMYVMKGRKECKNCKLG